MSSTDHRLSDKHREHAGARAARAGASFILGLFANQLADELSWPPAFTLLLVVSFFGIAYMLQQPFDDPIDAPSSGRLRIASQILERILERLISAIPLSLLLGLLLASISLLPVWDSRHITVPGTGYVWNYEVLAFAMCVGAQIVIFKVKADIVIRVVCSVALACGVAIYILAQKPENNDPTNTVIGWLITLILTTFALQLGFKVVQTNWLSDAYHAMIKRRT